MSSNFTDNTIHSVDISDINYKIKAIPFHATEQEWSEEPLVSYIPEEGEIIIYDSEHNETRIKIGDGIHAANELEFTGNYYKDLTEEFLEQREDGIYEAVDFLLLQSITGKYSIYDSDGAYKIFYCEVNEYDGTFYHTIISYSDDGFKATTEYVNGEVISDIEHTNGGTSYNTRLFVPHDPEFANEVVNKEYVDESMQKIVDNPKVAPWHEDEEYSGCYYRMVGEEKEWLNPPLVNNIRYRTADRVDNDIVYLKNRDNELIYCLKSELDELAASSNPNREIGRAYGRFYGAVIPFNWGANITQAGWYRLGNLAPGHASARTCAFRLIIGGSDAAGAKPAECIIDMVAGTSGGNTKITKVIGNSNMQQVTKVRICSNSSTSPRSYDIDIYFAAPTGATLPIVMKGHELLGTFSQYQFQQVTDTSVNVRAELDLTTADDLIGHISNINNPHHVTAAQTGAVNAAPGTSYNGYFLSVQNGKAAWTVLDNYDIKHGWSSTLSQAGWYRLGTFERPHSSVGSAAIRLAIGGSYTSGKRPIETIVDVISGHNHDIRKIAGSDNISDCGQITKIRIRKYPGESVYSLEVYYNLNTNNVVYIQGTELMGGFNKTSQNLEYVEDQTNAGLYLEYDLTKTVAESIGVISEIESANCPGCYYRIVDGEQEWINPPMQLNQEYRTTERYYSSVYQQEVPVYTMLVDFGEFPVEGTEIQKTVLKNDRFKCLPIRMSGRVHYGADQFKTLPYKTSTEEYSLQGGVDIGHRGYISIQAISGTLSEQDVFSCTVQVWYTKWDDM